MSLTQQVMAHFRLASMHLSNGSLSAAAKVLEVALEHTVSVSWEGTRKPCFNASAQYNARF